MLQTYQSPSVEVGEGAPADGPSFAELFFTALGFVRRQLLVILSLVLLAIGLAVVYLYVTPPVYKGVTRIIIDTSKEQVFKQSILEGPADAAMMDSQIEVLRSENFALSIISKLGLTRDPEFVGDAGVIGRVISLPFQLAHRILHPFESNKVVPDVTLRVVNTFEKRFMASRVGMSYVIEIAFLSTNPGRAAQIANAAADGFIVDQLEAKYQTIGQTTAWLQDRLNDLRAQASAAERAVVEYKTKHNIVDTGGHLINEQQLTELNGALAKARADRVEAQARLDRILQVINRGDLDPAATDVATVADALRSEVITKLRSQYLDLAQREALFSRRLGPNHLAVVNIRNQMQELGHSIFEELKRIAGASKSDYDIAKAREDSLQESLAAAVSGSQTTNKAQIELRQLESAAQSYRMLYDNFQQRYTDSVQAQSFPYAEARVITRASPPLQKTYPKGSVVLMLGIMGGLVAGVGLAVLRELSDRVFRTSKQVEAELKVECIAIVPRAQVDTMAAPRVTKAVPAGSRIVPRAQVDTKAAPRVTKAAVVPTGSRIIAPSAGLPRHVIDAPLSIFAESIRAVKLGVDLGCATKSSRVIGITSSVPNEGKSTIAASLAQQSAHGGASVILVDCDLRKPTLSQELVPNKTQGLLDVVTGTVGLDEVIWSDPASNLSFLPSGIKSRFVHTSEILASDATKHLFAQLRERYDYVIVDLSPLAPVVDARATTHLVDCYVFVVEWGKTQIGVAEHALNTARGIYDKLVGVVLNKADLKRLARYDSSRSGYYNNEYYSRYGYTE
jgi:succinoglycan biosynthesis transport protein ExoP